MAGNQSERDMQIESQVCREYKHFIHLGKRKIIIEWKKE